MSLTGATPQNVAALKYANVVRVKCASFKRALADLPMDEAIPQAAALLEDGKSTECAMTVRMLLFAIPKIRDDKSRRLLKRAGIHSGDVRVRDLTERQRLALADLLRNGGWRI